jgi:predicted nucleotide-binding protein (sugar kinase/HSP70/actin superfamily)
MLQHQHPKITKIGIPRGFYFYLYPGLWEPFFRTLGIEPLVSGPSSRETLERAVPVSESEHCLAHKLFDGHILSLKGRADAVFIPRILSMTRFHICCAKFGALPDASRCAAAAPVLAPEINLNREGLEKTLYRFARSLGASGKTAKEALSRGLASLAEAREEQRRAREALPPAGRLLLLGHPYTLEDAFISGPVIKKCRSLGLAPEPITFGTERIDPFPIRWCTFNRMYRRLQSLDTARYAAVIQISTFNCGPDSVMIDGYRRLCRKRGIPYMVLMVDEHSGAAGIETRIEAFADSLRWGNGRENHG